MTVKWNLLDLNTSSRFYFCNGTYLHGNRRFLLNIYQLYLTLQAEWSACTTLREAQSWDAFRSAAFSRCVDLVECVLVPVTFGRGVPWSTSSSLIGPSHQALTLLGEISVIAWRLKRLFFWRLPTEPDAFLELLGVSELRLCSRTYLENTDNLQAAWQYRKNIPNCCITPIFCIFVLLL